MKLTLKNGAVILTNNKDGDRLKITVDKYGDVTVVHKDHALYK